MGLQPAIVERLAKIAESREFGQGEYLWKQGDRAHAFHLVNSGKVALEIFIPHQGPLQIETMAAGDAIACSWVVESYRWHFDARALMDVSAVVLDGECLRQECDDDPILGYEMLKRLSRLQERSLQKTRLRIVELHSH
jgi:CRP-like cAMP-binding protein